MATGRIGTTPVLTTRWSKAPSAGTTSLSGLDDNSVSLVYSVGYEAVYQNGVLLSRGNDYTATNGTTITLTTATVAGDIIEVFANQTIPLTDTYSQTVANGKFINNTLTTTTGDIIYASAANTPARLGIGSTDQVLKVSGGIPAWGATPTPGFKGCLVYKSTATTLANATNVTLAYDTEVFDTDAFHSTSSNLGRITIPSGLDGKYLFYAFSAYQNNAGTGFRNTSFYNGTDYFADSYVIGSTSQRLTIYISQVFNLVAGNYIEVTNYQTSGSNLDINGGIVRNYFGCNYLGA